VSLLSFGFDFDEEIFATQLPTVKRAMGAPNSDCKIRKQIRKQQFSNLLSEMSLVSFEPTAQLIKTRPKKKDSFKKERILWCSTWSLL
jgi:hypothetical protein